MSFPPLVLVLLSASISAILFAFIGYSFAKKHFDTHDEEQKLIAQLAQNQEALTQTLELKNTLEKQVLVSESKRQSQGEQTQELRQSLAELQQECATLRTTREELAAAQSALRELRKQLEDMAMERDGHREDSEGLKKDNAELARKLSALQSTLDAEQSYSAQHIASLKQAREELSAQFKALASDILDQKAQSLSEKSQQDIRQLLAPLRLNLDEFRKQIDSCYSKESRERIELAAQVNNLISLNHKLSDDANNLTQALQGQTKIQGNWGELILERILEMSGLRKDIEFTLQESHSQKDGSRVQPDAIIHLPDNKHLVVDSKVSLNAYLDFTAAEADEVREQALKRHIISVQKHITELSQKNYQQIYGLESLDFVFMFVPVEPAFLLAISHKKDLWQEAWDKNILLVSPSTFLFAIRTVAHIWRQEHQTQNAYKIAERGALLYDKFAGFCENMEQLGSRLDQAHDAYEKACGQLYKGTGNLVRQTQILQELGVKNRKDVPRSMAGQLYEDSPDAKAQELITEE